MSSNEDYYVERMFDSDGQYVENYGCTMCSIHEQPLEDGFCLMCYLDGKVD